MIAKGFYNPPIPCLKISHKYTFFALLTVLFLVILSQTSGATAEWTEWRGSPDHSALETGSVPSEGMLRWSYKTADQVQSSPVFYEGGMLIGSDDGKLYCMDPETGELNWKFTTNGSIQATPLIRNGRAYFGSLDGTFYCLELPNQDNGLNAPEMFWYRRCYSPIVSSAHYYNDSVIFGGHDGWFYRIGLDSSSIWIINLDGDFWATPLIDPENDIAYVGNIDGDFSAIHLENGTVKWTIDAGEIYSSGCLRNGLIYIPTGENETLLAINASDGSTMWYFDIGHPSYSVKL